MIKVFRKINKYHYLIIALCCFITGAIIENNLLKKHPETYLIDDFRDKLSEYDIKLSVYLDKISMQVSDENFDGDFNTFLNEDLTWLKDNGFGILVYREGDLYYWSDRAISFYESEQELPDKRGLIILSNGYYLIRKLEIDNYNLYGLQLIKYNYSYENKYLRNIYFDEYKLPDEYKISEAEEDETFPIYDTQGDYLFSVKPVGNYLCTEKQLYIPGVIYFLGLIFLLLCMRQFFIESDKPFLIRLVFLLLALFVVYWIHLIFKVPKVFIHFDFFSPAVFALNDWLPSLGDFFLLSLFLQAPQLQEVK